MTPKEKAEQLFTRFNKEGLQELVPLMDRFDRKKVIKQCALIAVDEILEGYEFDSLYMQDKRVMDNINFWDEVKQEIRKL